MCIILYPQGEKNTKCKNTLFFLASIPSVFYLSTVYPLGIGKINPLDQNPSYFDIAESPYSLFNLDSFFSTLRIREPVLPQNWNQYETCRRNGQAFFKFCIDSKCTHFSLVHTLQTTWNPVYNHTDTKIWLF